MPQKGSVLVVTAHPDDELFVSGTLCLLNERGYTTYLVCATDRGAGTSDDAEVEQMRRIRRLELELSAVTLGVHAFTILPNPDVSSRCWGATAPWDLETFERDLSMTISALSPVLILTHGPFGGYGHPAHKQVFTSVMRAAEQSAYRHAIYSFCGRIGKLDALWRYFDQSSDVVVNVRRYQERRAAALNYHQSQWSFFLKPVMPQGLRGLAGVILPLLLSFSKRGRRRLPIYTAQSFFRRFPEEGLVRQKPAEADAVDPFLGRLAHDPSVHVLVRAGEASSQRQPFVLAR